MATHYRKDGPGGLTAPNPDAVKDVVAHITKHRGMKTVYTSVSEDERAIRHFGGDALYKTDSDVIIGDKHAFPAHVDFVGRFVSKVSDLSVSLPVN